MARRSRPVRRGLLPANQPFLKAVASSVDRDLQSARRFAREMLPEKTLLEYDPVPSFLSKIKQIVSDYRPGPVTPGYHKIEKIRSNNPVLKNVRVIYRGPGYKPIFIVPKGHPLAKHVRLNRPLSHVLGARMGYDPKGRLDDSIICEERSTRREIMHANGSAGAKVATPKYSDKSQVDC